MKKILILLIVTLVGSISVNAQSDSQEITAKDLAEQIEECGTFQPKNCYTVYETALQQFHCAYWYEGSDEPRIEKIYADSTDEAFKKIANANSDKKLHRLSCKLQ